MLSRVAYLLDGVNLKNLCYLYFFLAPVFLDRTSDGLMVGLYGAAYLLSGMIIALAVSERLLAFSERVRFNMTSLLVVVMIVVVFLSVLINTPAKFTSPWYIYFKYGRIVFPVLVFFVMINIWTRRDAPRLYTVLLFAGVASMLALIPEFALHISARGLSLPRAGDMLFGDPNKYAVFLNVIYGMLLCKALAHFKEGRTNVLLLGAILLVCFVLFLTQSRGGIFTFIVVTGVCLWASRSGRAVFLAGLAMIPLGGLFVLSVITRYSAGHEAVMSDMGRIWSYAVALNTIQDRPIRGVGFANVVEMYEQYGGFYLQLLQRPMPIHNATLEAFAELGIFGLIAYLALVFVPIFILGRRVARISRERFPVVETAALIVPVAFFCYGIFSHQYLTDPQFWAFMAFTMIVLRSPAEKDDLRFLSPKWV